jgi:hypothetical protein
MADTVLTDTALSGGLTNILNLLSAAAALGTAAMGLVDSSKAFFGGPSNFGFGHLAKAIKPFLAAGGAATAFGEVQILQTLKANWLNGVAKAEQKAKARALIHLGLTTGNARALAKAAGVSEDKLAALAQKTADGAAASAEEINVLGQFDAIVSAVLDDAYERGDQIYRNMCKLLALLASTVLAVIGGWVAFGGSGYFTSPQLVVALIVGVSATPLAPIAKDLSTSLQTAVSAVRAVKR